MASDKTPTTIVNESTRTYTRSVFQFVNYIKGSFITWISGEQTSDINETSVVMSLSLPSYKFLFTGDVGTEGLEEALNYYESSEGCYATDFTHMQIPHHGSRKNLNPQLIKRISASNYYVSCPPNGFSEGHPSKRLLNKIHLIFPQASIYNTTKGWLSHYSNLKVEGTPAVSFPVFDKIDA